MTTKTTGRRPRLRVAAIAIAACVGGVTPLGSAVASEPVGPPDCPVGFPYTMTLDQALIRYAGYVPEANLREAFAGYDKNSNGYACYKIPGIYTYYPFVYFFQRDDLEGIGPA